MSWRKRNWQQAKARNTWWGMIRRCHDPDHGKGYSKGVPRYEEYGGRGVKVSKRWRGEGGFKQFLKDVGLPPTKNSTLDRKNPKRGYGKSNCRWVDPQTQQENKRTTHWVVVLDPETGEETKLCLSGWSRKTGVKAGTIRQRIERGWPLGDAVALPALGPGQRYQFPPAPF